MRRRAIVPFTGCAAVCVLAVAFAPFLAGTRAQVAVRRALFIGGGYRVQPAANAAEREFEASLIPDSRDVAMFLLWREVGERQEWSSAAMSGNGRRAVALPPSVLPRGMAIEFQYGLVERGRDLKIATAPSTVTVRPRPTRALFVASDRYQDPRFPPLAHAESDARRLEALLRSGFAFETDLLLGATKSTFMSKLAHLGDERPGASDQLLIYLGQYVHEFHGSNLVFVDDARSFGNLLPLDELLHAIDELPWRRILVVLDTPGDPAKTAPVSGAPARDAAHELSLATRTRLLLETGHGSSSFSDQLFAILRPLQYATARQVIEQFDGEKAEAQQPGLRAFGSHEGGTFVFERRDLTAVSASARARATP